MAKAGEQVAASHLLVVIDHQEARVYRTEVHGVRDFGTTMSDTCDYPDYAA